MKNTIEILKENNFELIKTTDGFFSKDLVFKYNGIGHFPSVICRLQNENNVAIKYYDIENEIIHIREYRVMLWLTKYSGSADIEQIATEVYDIEEARKIMFAHEEEIKKEYRYSDYSRVSVAIFSGHKEIERKYLL